MTRSEMLDAVVEYIGLDHPAEIGAFLAELNFRLASNPLIKYGDPSIPTVEITPVK